MQEIIKVRNASYERYEELLNQKEALKKEAEKYRVSYDRILGKLKRETNEAKTDCVRKRKILSYCQNVAAIGEVINKKELDEFVEKAMEDYKKTLAYLLDAQQEEEPTVKQAPTDKQVKSIYRKIAKLVHPDMNSDIGNDKTIQDLWNRACIAYNCSNINELEELDVLINRYLNSKNNNYDEIEIPNVEEKIFNLNRDIKEILHTNPYQYKYILADKETMKMKKEELKKELKDYKRYIRELDKQIKKFNIMEIEE